MDVDTAGKWLGLVATSLGILAILLAVFRWLHGKALGKPPLRITTVPMLDGHSEQLLVSIENRSGQPVTLTAVYFQLKGVPIALPVVTYTNNKPGEQLEDVLMQPAAVIRAIVDTSYDPDMADLLSDTREMQHVQLGRIGVTHTLGDKVIETKAVRVPDLSAWWRAQPAEADIPLADRIQRDALAGRIPVPLTTAVVRKYYPQAARNHQNTVLANYCEGGYWTSQGQQARFRRVERGEYEPLPLNR